MTTPKPAPTSCNKWLDTLSDAQLDDHSQTSLANEAWNRGAAHAAQEILSHIEYVDTTKLGAARLYDEATAVGKARVECDRFIVKVEVS